ncbi:hypothetical protein E8E13_007538 [Curvularia kusanoi]|uniref:non-specific serine/threonine protein kinase n=1 Tax=Curvularia kusanoi TaxID=90978 RepID=A0A9P4W906_CURKU|nr:hypothetical protein E8E13_007538 [Curvularia kusanoi]
MSLIVIISDSEANQQRKMVEEVSIWDRYKSTLETCLTKERLDKDTVDKIAACLTNLRYQESWCSNPKIYYLSRRMNRLDLIPEMLDHGVTDLWLPLQKRLVRKWLNDAETKAFMDIQESVLDEDVTFEPQGRHFALESMDNLDLERVKYLGAGGFGEVWHVHNRRNGQAYACKTMTRPVRYDNHAILMQNFTREIMGMRLADIDLADLLNADLNNDQLTILWHSIGCITSALAYLHGLKIRHDDLKPNNILIHGTNVLLTDFGFW